MSKYHKHCGTSGPPPKKKTNRGKKPRMIPKITIPKPIETQAQDENKPINMVGLLTTKAFCDCHRCGCRDCPDILQLLSITVSDTTCHFGSKVSEPEDVPPTPKPSKPATLKLLDFINPNRDCSCSVVAKGIRDHIHMNLGMTGRRDRIREQAENCDQECKPNKDADAKQETKVKEKTVITKDNPPANKTDDGPCRMCR